MASADFVDLSLRNVTAYNPNGSYVSSGYVFTIGSYGKQNWSNKITLDTLNVSTIFVASTYIVQNIGASTLIGSTFINDNEVSNYITVSTLDSNRINYSTQYGGTINAVTTYTNLMNITSTGYVSTLNANYLVYSSMAGSSISTNYLTINSTLYVSSLNTLQYTACTLIASTVSTNTGIFYGNGLTNIIGASDFISQFGSAIGIGPLAPSLYGGIEIIGRRNSTSVNNWTTTSLRIRKKVDSQVMSYIDFGRNPNDPTGMGFGNGNSEYMCITGSGLVGIGTLTPNTLLTVAGNISTNNITAGSTLNISTVSTRNIRATNISSVNLSSITLTGPLSLGANKATTSYVPTAGIDLTNKSYVDSLISGSVAFSTLTLSSLLVSSVITTSSISCNSLSSVIVTGTLNLGTNKAITSYNPVNPNDLTNKNYVDFAITGSLPLPFSSFTGSTLVVNNLTATNFTLIQSTLNVNTVLGSTIIGSTINTNSLTFSTLIGSTITNNTQIINSTLIASTINTTSLTYSTLIGSTITNNTQTINSTLTTSTITASGNVSVTGALGSGTASITGASASISGALGSGTASITGASASISGALGSATASITGASASISGALGSGTASITGASAQLTGVTANSALITDGNSNIVASATTSTELGYVSGVTSPIQTQINSLSANTINQSDTFSKFTTSLYEIGNTWTQVAYSKAWRGLSLSASGQYQTAGATNTLAIEYLYTSSDYGNTWTQKTTDASGNSLQQEWTGVSLSASGQYQTAVAGDVTHLGNTKGYIYISSDYGNTWYKINPTGQTMPWVAISISASGQYQTAGASYDYIYTSSDYGNTWTQRFAVQKLYGIAVSGSGQYQVACSYGDYIYVSSNYGNTWIQKTTDINNNSLQQNWTSVSVSGSGQYQVSTVYNGYIYVSSDYGNTWIQRGSIQNYQCISMSASGQYMVTAVGGGNYLIYISSDYGYSWSSTATSRNWLRISISASGQYISAGVYLGYIYTSYAIPSNTINKAGDTMTGTLTINGNGNGLNLNGTSNQSIYTTSTDAYNPTGQNNLMIQSWWGIGFPSYDNNIRIAMDTRTGNMNLQGSLTSVGGTMTGALNMGGNKVTSSATPSSGDDLTNKTYVDTSVSNRIPYGVIVMWYGSIVSIPAGWALCNGSSGTPNLQDRFIVGAGSTYGVGNTGGQNSITLSVTQLPTHNHSVNTSDLAHTHNTRTNSYQTSNSGNGGCPQFAYGNDNVCNTYMDGYTTSYSYTNATVNTSNTGSGSSIDIKPLYYALCYIMKI
jgi:Phage Tail Collar Domain